MVAAANSEHENQGKGGDVIKRQYYQGGIARRVLNFLGQATGLGGIGKDAQMA
jgi:hypothetical protein